MSPSRASFFMFIRRESAWLRDGISMRYAAPKSFGLMQRPRTRAAHASLSDAVLACAFGRNVMTNAKIVATMIDAVDDVRQAVLPEEREHGGQPVYHASLRRSTAALARLRRGRPPVTLTARFSSASANLSSAERVAQRGGIFAYVIS